MSVLLVLNREHRELHRAELGGSAARMAALCCSMEGAMVGVRGHP